MRKMVLGLVGMVFLGGCVADYEDKPEQFMNGCICGANGDVPSIGIDSKKSPFCVTVAPAATVHISLEDTMTCHLCGGFSTGDVGTPDPNNPIQKKAGGCWDLTNSLDVATDGGQTVIPFYCKEDAAIAGAIFVDSKKCP